MIQLNSALVVRHHNFKIISVGINIVDTVTVKIRMPVLRHEEDSITRSPLDSRKYRHLTLDNELQVLLVSDAATEKAAASLAVRVGYLCDPDDIPGLAHFCEHMLFLGTEKYPSENAYREFLSQHAGSSNATTSAEFTTFFFDVGWEQLAGALDRFAQFFQTPLFNASATDREVKAVDSENDRNLQEDVWRVHQVLKELSKEGHPHRKFQTGNSYTLGSHPQELGMDVREELMKFHSQHYSSNLMRLAVIGRETLDDLTDLVEGLFSPVVNMNIPTAEFPDHPYSPNELQLWIECVPVKELRQIKIEFPIPDLDQYYYCDPKLYVAHLIGHEGPGSLFAHLKAKGWCNLLEAGPSPGAKGYEFFVIGMVLSSEGEEHVNEIVETVFQYLALMRSKGPQRTLFQECADINAMEFRFQDKQKSQSYALFLSKCMHEFPTADILSGMYLQKEFRPDLIDLLLSHLTPQNVRVCVVGKRFEAKTEHKERWYGTEYSYRKIAPETISQWEAVDGAEQLHLHLPAVNEFIPTDFELAPLPDGAPKIPVLVQDSEMSKVWFKQDDTFFLPKACLCFLLSTPLAYRDPLSTLMSSLFTRLLVDALNEYAYYAEIAGIQYEITINFYGLIMKIVGYRHKQSILLSRIMEKMTQFEVDHKRFAVHKETLARQLKNFNADQPYRHAMYYTGALLVHPCWTNAEMESAIDGITAEQLQAFIPQLLAAMHIEALVVGNISKEESLKEVALVEDALRSHSNTQPLPASAITRHQTVQLPNGSSHQFSVSNSVHNSCSLEVYLQTGQEDTRSNVLLELTQQIISEPCFDILRTKEQLGYIVSSGLRRSNGVQGLRVVVQSDKKVQLVERRTEAFLLSMKSHLSGLSEEAFSSHKKALEVKRTEKPKKLNEECRRYWSEIMAGMYHFNRDEEEVAVLREITKEDIITFFQEFFAPEGSRRSKLVVHVVPTKTAKTMVAAEGESGGKGEGKGEAEAEKEEGEAEEGEKGEEDIDSGEPLLPEATVISDMTLFKSSLPLFPSATPFIPTSL